METDDPPQKRRKLVGRWRLPTSGDARCTFTGKYVDDLVKLNQEVFDMQCALRRPAEEEPEKDR